MSEIILYDIPSKNQTCWSLNPWKTRLALNFKNVPYTTQWVEYPNIAPVLKAAGTPANVDTAPYTSPAVQFPAKPAPMMDSHAIALELERLHPTPSLHVSDPIVEQVMAVHAKMFPGFAAVLLPPVPRVVLGEASIPYFVETRAKSFGMSLDDLEKAKGGDVAWDEVRGVAEEMAALLKVHDDGPFYLGKKLTYADFITVAFLEFLKRLDGGFYQRWVAFDPVFQTLYEACGEWLKRDDK